MKTRVYITTDVECAEERVIGGKNIPPQGFDVRVWGRFTNQARDLGIGLIMRELEAQGLRGTFFTEVLGSHYFGQNELEKAVHAMHARGHDVQLHAHPIQRVADYRTRGVPPAPDNMADYDEARQTEILKEGIAILEACGIPRGQVSGFRAGNYGANNATWSAMASAGLTVSSSYNPSYFDKNCKMRFDGSAPGLFDTRVAMPAANVGDPSTTVDRHVWELPISNFRDAGGGFRHVQITAVSLEETKRYLNEARACGIREVTLVTHSFELCHIDDPVRARGRVNSINLLRLRGLCRFLARNGDVFEVDTVGDLARRLRDGHEPATAASLAPLPTAPSAGPARGGQGSDPRYPTGLARHKARRLFEQAFKRVEAKVPVSFAAATLARP